MTTGSAALAERLRLHKITRLCHLTPSRNLVHIACEGGISSTGLLESEEGAVFTPQDRLRLDQRRSHISCSIQYPNAWYFRQKKNPGGEAGIFKDWVVLGLDPRCMLRPNTLFCPENAAGSGGANLQGGPEGFDAMYADLVVDSAKRTFSRENSRLEPCPTNDQAEVMIADRIPLEDIESIFVPDTAQAARVHAQLEQVGADPNGFGYMIAESFFNPRRMSAEIRKGVAPAEIPWNPPG